MNGNAFSNCSLVLGKHRSVFAAIGVLLACLSAAACAAEPDWSADGQLLERHLGRRSAAGIELAWLDYSALRQDPAFSRVVEQIAAYPPENLRTREERLAFHINAYNILAIKTVLDHWPVESIKDAGSLLRPVWKRPAGEVGGKTLSLDEIEDGLRKLGEPRIHMAIVCASKSCPDLRREPYAAAKLDQQLSDAATAFLSNPAKGLRVENGAIRVSKIFDWFGGDFDAAGGVAAFLSRYYPELPVGPPVRADLPYDWSLNGQ
ncbi:DUF547 domain-containing protein [Methylococcus sp. ANG]|uniref:DUF547 domain-containing protein n=1 Tax=Methylococcus sp. ANG TaxID=3231903 RepID=UPI00345A0E99